MVNKNIILKYISVIQNTSRHIFHIYCSFKNICIFSADNVTSATNITVMGCLYS